MTAAFEDVTEEFDDPAEMDPEPLTGDMPEARPYPIDALPELMRAAAVEYQAYGQQPLAMVATSAMAALSLAAQHLADVERGPELVGPVSLNTLTVAISGERKTSSDRTFTAGLRELEDDKRAQATEAAIKHRVAMLDFKHKRDALDARLKEARKGTKGTTDKGVDAITRALEDLDMAEPVAPPERIMFHSDSTSERLALDLAAGWPSASVWSNEGGIVAGGHAMRDETAMATIALLNCFWDGQPYRRRRARAESCELRGVRVTCAIMVQPLVFKHLAHLAGGAVRGMGLFARFLLAWPASTMGTRLYRAPAPGTPAMAAFQARLVELASIEPEFPEDERGRTVYQLHVEPLPLAPDAFELWRQFHDDVERELAAEGDFADVCDVAAKVADNAARIACLFHVFDHGPAGAVGAEHMRAGTALGAWHLYEAQRVFGLARQDKETEAAVALLKWMLGGKADLFGPRDIQRGAPRALRRDGGLRSKAIGLLVDKYWLTEETAQGIDLYRLHPKARSFAKQFGLT
jgi:Protein of unknown function (DUF3987)